MLPRYGIVIDSYIHKFLSISHISEQNSEDSRQLDLIPTRKEKMNSLYLNAQQTPQGVRVLFRDQVDGLCLHWKKGLMGTQDAYFQQCNDNRYVIDIAANLH